MTRDTDLISHINARMQAAVQMIADEQGASVDEVMARAVEWLGVLRSPAHPVQEPPSPGVTAGATVQGEPVAVFEPYPGAFDHILGPDKGGDADDTLCHDAGASKCDGLAPVPVVPAEGLSNRRAYQVGYAAGQAAALRSAPPVGARVKPLEWHRIGTFGGDCYDASATGVVYRIVPKANGTFWLTAPSTTTATLEAAKAAAQADYEARVLAALLPAGEGE